MLRVTPGSILIVTCQACSPKVAELFHCSEDSDLFILSECLSLFLCNSVPNGVQYCLLVGALFSCVTQFLVCAILEIELRIMYAYS